MIGCYSEVYHHFSSTVEHNGDHSWPSHHTNHTVKNLDTMAGPRMNARVKAIDSANDNDNHNENETHLYLAG